MQTVVSGLLTIGGLVVFAFLLGFAPTSPATSVERLTHPLCFVSDSRQRGRHLLAATVQRCSASAH